MVHYQWLLEEKEKRKVFSPIKCHYPTLWHALKPSCDCAISQIRYLKKTKQHLHLILLPSLLPGVKVQVELVLCLCHSRADCWAEQLQPAWPCSAAGEEGVSPLLESPRASHLPRLLVLGSLCYCICATGMTCLGWIKDDFAQCSFCHSKCIGIFVLRHQIQHDLSCAPFRL